MQKLIIASTAVQKWRNNKNMSAEELSELIIRSSIVLCETFNSNDCTLTAELIDGRTIEINIKEKE